MLFFIKRIIQHMLDFYRRLCQAFFLGSPAIAGIAWLFRNCSIVFIVLIIIALICFLVALIGLWCDYKDARRKDKQAKAPKHPQFDGKTIKRF